MKEHSFQICVPLLPHDLHTSPGQSDPTQAVGTQSDEQVSSKGCALPTHTAEVPVQTLSLDELAEEIPHSPRLVLSLPPRWYHQVPRQQESMAPFL